eukprot:TRINITY_DN25471_c0_g1_i1.p1 TRINITY_DN25471_c0_g1~~TRINITY_DN25471_c0_g1_i1.p1  ORF type:complete len:211 (-),score=43.97 TRINITY_DN25471_c0_g1_i1:189-821(-)
MFTPAAPWQHCSSTSIAAALQRADVSAGSIVTVQSRRRLHQARPWSLNVVCWGSTVVTIIAQRQRSRVGCHRSPIIRPAIIDTEPTCVDVDKARKSLEQQLSNDSEGNSLLLCRKCGAVVAALRFCVGSSRHFNPAGYLFHIGQFCRAAGAVAVGKAESADSWFEGWDWRIGVCRGCGHHLGWRYEQQSKEPFWGLIWNRLIKARRPDAL